jgi:hypothetical protein
MPWPTGAPRREAKKEALLDAAMVEAIDEWGDRLE